RKRPTAKAARLAIVTDASDSVPVGAAIGTSCQWPVATIRALSCAATAQARVVVVAETETKVPVTPPSWLLTIWPPDQCVMNGLPNVSPPAAKASVLPTALTDRNPVPAFVGLLPMPVHW